MTTKAHSDPERGKWTSASNAEADSLCPARHLRGLGLPDESNPDAERGTRIHARLTGEAVTPPLDADEFDCMEELTAQEAIVYSEWKRPNAKIEEHREERLWIKIDGGLEHSGKADLVIIDTANDRALVIDYKTGRGEVTESPSNLQLRDLAVLVAASYSLFDITVAIVQQFHKALLCSYNREDLIAAMEQMEARIQASNDPKAKAVPGDKQCKYCKAKRNCREFADSVLDVVNVPLQIENPTQDQIEGSIKALAPARLGAFLGLVRLASDCAEEEVRKRLASGQAVPGWKIGEPSERESITDPNQVHERFVNRGGSTTLFMDCISVAKGKLKTALKTATGLKGKELDGALKDLVAGCIDTKQVAGKLERE